MTVAVLPELTMLPAMTERGKCERQAEQMKVTLQRKMPRLKDLQAFVAPYSSSVAWTAHEYDRNAIDILDETIFYARTTLGSFLASAMTNPSRVWSQWSFPNPMLSESQAAKQFLHDLNERRATILAQSNFYATMDWVYEEWPTFATAVVLIEEDEEDVVRYVPWGIGSYGMAEDARGNVNALWREFPMTVRQIVERFATRPDGNIDYGALSPSLASLVKSGMLETQISVSHLICPNDHYNPSKSTPDAFRFASYYWETGTQETVGYNGFLAKDGYREWPAMVFRWKRVVGDPFGVDSPGIATLGANKSLQQMESDMLMAVEKLVKPPLVTPPELTHANLLPAGQNPVTTRAGQVVGPLHVTDPVAVQIIAETQDKIRDRLFGMWFTRLILALTGEAQGRERTAREVEEISQEKFLVLGRAVESAASAFKAGAEREFAIFARAGLLPEVPPELEGEPLVIEYTSLLAIAQRSIGLSTLREYGLTLAEMAKMTGDPAILDRTNWSEWAQQIGDRFGVNPKVQRSDEEVAEREEARNRAAAEAQAAENNAKEAKAAKDLGTTPMDADSALTALMNQGQQQALV